MPFQLSWLSAYPLPGQMKKSVLATDKGALLSAKKIQTILMQADSGN
jgi:hypothetical protein